MNPLLGWRQRMWWQTVLFCCAIWQWHWGMYFCLNNLLLQNLVTCPDGAISATMCILHLVEHLKSWFWGWCFFDVWAISIFGKKMRFLYLGRKWFFSAQVFRQMIWMRHYGAQSWKQTRLWSNSLHVKSFDLGPLDQEQRQTSTPLARTYQDPYGKKRCAGKKKELRESQYLAGTSILKRSIYLKWKFRTVSVCEKTSHVVRHNAT